MKHVIIGGNGFTGRFLAKALLATKQKVVVCDVQSDNMAMYKGAEFIQVDITSPKSLDSVSLKENDIVYHLAARQYHLHVPRRDRQEFFDEVNVSGTENVLDLMIKNGCKKLIYFSTDMVYGLPDRVPVENDHPQSPLGPYGQSKLKSERLCSEYRKKGLQITIFRPRLIIGPGRLGVLAKLFRLIDKNLPVPLIGNGSNFYQMISVFDCVSATIDAVNRGVPNAEYNLGSESPPSVHVLLSELIKSVGSKTRLIKTPGTLVKFVLSIFDRVGLTILYKEQYAIADVNYLVDISRTENELGWKPQYKDTDMIFQAYEEYKKTTGNY